MIILLFLVFVAFCVTATTSLTALIQIIITGLILSLAVFGLACAIQGYSIRKEWLLFRAIPYLFLYAVGLFAEIVKANSLVFFSIFRGSKPDGVIAVFHSGMTSSFGNMLLANAITLTPGTVTVHLEGDCFTVHCLFESYSQGLGDSFTAKMAKRIDKLMEKSRSQQKKRRK